jgi:hypothetical protein
VQDGASKVDGGNFFRFRFRLIFLISPLQEED